MTMLTSWNEINWKECNLAVALYQDKLTIAASHKDEASKSEIKRLQNKLIRSFAARALAVRRVVENRGKRTPGIDGDIWSTDAQKLKAIRDLKSLRDYHPHPVRRVWIDKPGKTEKRPLGIPTMFDRAVQALVLQALEPVTEARADARSFGFRKYRSAHDAATYIKLIAGSMYGTKHIVEVDIRKLFDSICHNWILNNIPMPKTTLKRMLKAGLMDSSRIEFSPGVSQGGILSPCIANAVLDGLEDRLLEGPKTYLCRYADDFVILAHTEAKAVESLEIVKRFLLSERKLLLHPDKTRISNIRSGFDFLGFTFREYPDRARLKGNKAGIFLVTPTKNNITELCRRLSGTIRQHRSSTAGILIMKLNPILRGWAEYYRSCSSRGAFSKISCHVFNRLKQWALRRHKGTAIRKALKLYFKTQIVGRGQHRSVRKWVFTGKNHRGDDITLFQIGYVNKTGHMMIRLKSKASPRPYNPFRLDHSDYFEKRIKQDVTKNPLVDNISRRLILRQKGICVHCKALIKPDDVTEINHKVPIKEGGTNKTTNLEVLHQVCHKAVTAKGQT